MLKAIQSFFNNELNETVDDSDQRLNLAAAALLIEIIMIDDDFKEQERKALYQLLASEYHIEANAIDELVSMAEKEVRDSNDLYQFTRLINDNYDYPKRCQLIESLWLIAFADNELDKYEESMIRKIADLIYVDHTDFIKAKLSAKNRA